MTRNIASAASATGTRNTKRSRQALALLGLNLSHVTVRKIIAGRRIAA